MQIRHSRKSGEKEKEREGAEMSKRERARERERQRERERETERERERKRERERVYVCSWLSNRKIHNYYFYVCVCTEFLRDEMEINVLGEKK